MPSLPYRFANLLWVDYVFEPHRSAEFLVRLTLFCITPWLAGLLIALAAHRLHQYLITPAFYLGSLGILLTTIGLIHGSTKQYIIYDRFLSCFVIPENEKQDIVRNTLARHSAFYSHMRTSSTILIFGLLFTLGGFLWWPHVSFLSMSLGTFLPRFSAFSMYGWYDDSIKAYSAAIVAIFAVFISLPLGTGASIMLRMPLFLWKNSNRVPQYPPALIKAYFAPATRLYSQISLLWLVGALMMAYFVGLNKDWLSLTAVVSLFLLGIVNFVLPQVAYVRAVSAAEDRFLDVIARSFESEVNVTTTQETNLDSTNMQQSGKQANILGLIQLMRHDGWVYPVHQTYTIVLTYSLSLLSSVVGWNYLISRVDVIWK